MPAFALAGGYRASSWPESPRLDAAAGRLEQRRHGEGGGGHDQAGVVAEELAEA
jgi:hypothetical protein